MTLEELEDTLPWGLHDSHLEMLEIDWVRARATFTVRVAITEHQEMDQRARITVTGLVFVSVDPPEIGAARGYIPTTAEGLWIDTGAGAANPEAATHLPAVPEGCFLHYIFVNDWNRFMHVCGRDAELTWIESTPVPSRARTRALFPGESIPNT